jgi:hypothetical protein
MTGMSRLSEPTFKKNLFSLSRSFINNNLVIDSLDFTPTITTIQPIMQHQEPDLTTHTMQYQSIISYLKFYHLIDGNFYLVKCKILQDASFDDDDNYNHDFFYKHPINSSVRYHVTCKLLPHSLIENMLNDEIDEMNYDIEVLSPTQKFNLQQSLSQKLYYRMCDDGNHTLTTQTVLITNVQNYNDGNLTSNDRITHQDTNNNFLHY